MEAKRILPAAASFVNFDYISSHGAMPRARLCEMLTTPERTLFVLESCDEQKKNLYGPALGHGVRVEG